MENQTFALSGLIKKRAAIAGEIESTQAQLRALIKDIEHIDAAIKIFDPDFSIEAIKPKAFRPPEDWSHRGQMRRMVLSTLQQASEPLTTRDIAVQLMVERAIDRDDLRMVRLMSKRVGVCLRHLRDNKAVVATQGPGQFMLWGLSVFRSNNSASIA